ncbi:EF-hand domain-containing protein [Thalassospira marina]|uniref:EF-hand domain-containing protein n=1 Tax=Thalassospira marina TaxID=2048283 RepID=A0A2N3KWN6_9PROT|nr:EF-hand domain-containing protein [Thalassospira marina]PKR54974.1 hypothetical protein COO20_06180 [Thalassospira marina]
MTSGISGLGLGGQIFSSRSADKTSALGAIEDIAGFSAGSASTEDTKSSSSVSGTDNLLKYSPQMSDSLQAFMVGLQESTQSSQSNGAAEASQMFADLDSNGDGTLSREEFLAGKPDDVSDEQAENLWNQISGGSESGVSQDDFVTAMQSGAGAPPAGGGSGGDGEESYDARDTNKDGVVSLEELMAASSGIDSVSDDDLANLINSDADGSSGSSSSALTGQANAGLFGGTFATTGSNVNFDNRVLAQMMTAQNSAYQTGAGVA